MSVRYGASIPTDDSLVLFVDAGNPKSYPGSGTTWYDLSKRKNDMSLVNGPVYSSATGSFNFDGSNDYAVTNVSDIDPFFDAHSFTTICWFNVDSFNNGYMFSHGESFDTDKIKWGLHTSNSSNIFRSWFEAADDADYFLNGDGEQLQAGNWYQGVVTYDGATNAWRMWVNGSLVNTGTPAQDPAFIDQPIVIGCRNNNGGVYQNFFDGSVAIAQYYTRVLTDNEIRQTFRAFRGRFGI